MAIILPELPYAYDALEPYIDEEAMHCTTDKHHQTYVTMWMQLLKNILKWRRPESLLAMLNPFRWYSPSCDQQWWWSFEPHALSGNWWLQNKQLLQQNLLQRLMLHLVHWRLQSSLHSSLTTRFGSGWAWLVVNKEGKLEVTSTANQDTPISEGKPTNPWFGCLEHAYYVKYRNVRLGLHQSFLLSDQLE